jgi:hypothetical protein
MTAEALHCEAFAVFLSFPVRIERQSGTEAGNKKAHRHDAVRLPLESPVYAGRRSERFSAA